MVKLFCFSESNASHTRSRRCIVFQGTGMQTKWQVCLWEECLANNGWPLSHSSHYPFACGWSLQQSLLENSPGNISKQWHNYCLLGGWNNCPRHYMFMTSGPSPDSSSTSPHLLVVKIEDSTRHLLLHSSNHRVQLSGVLDWVLPPLHSSLHSCWV